MSTKRPKEWNIRLEFVPMSKLFIDDSYQRDLKVRHANKIANNFNEDLFGPLIVAPRENGKFAVTDGQHRFMALQKLGFVKAPCAIVKGGTISKESEIFVQQSEGVLRLTPLDKFKAAVQENRKMEVAINSLLSELDFRLSPTPSTVPRTIQSIKSLIAVFKQQGEAGLKETLKIISDAWGNEHVFVHAPIITGIASFNKIFGKHECFNMSRLITVLKKTTPEALVIKSQPFVQAGKSRESSMVESLLQTYNYNNRGQKLPERG